MKKANLVSAVIEETRRIEEDSLHSMKGHLNAGSLWSWVHLFLGLPSAVLATFAGITALSGEPKITAILALLAAVLTSVMTFLKPQQVANNHNNAGREYNILKNRVRRFREIELLQLDWEIRVHRVDNSAIIRKINELAEKRDELNSMSPDIPRWAYKKAKKDIDAGMAEYQVDAKKNNDG